MLRDTDSTGGAARVSACGSLQRLARRIAGPVLGVAAFVAGAAQAAPLAQATPTSWSMTGCSRLAYVQTIPVSKLKQRYELKVSHPDGTHAVTVLASDEPLMTPAWSPDGRLLAYTQFLDGRTEIVEQRLANRFRQTLSFKEGLNSAPAYSPDGNFLAFSLSNGSAVNIFVKDLRTQAIRQLTNSKYVDTEPTWSPDGKSIAFTSDRAGATHIYSVPSAGGRTTVVSPSGAVHPVFTPDGHSLVFASIVGRAYRICRYDLRTRQVHIVTSGHADQNPTLSPDGKYLVWVGGTMTQRTLEGVALDHPGRPLWTGPSGVQEVAWSRCVFAP